MQYLEALRRHWRTVATIVGALAALAGVSIVVTDLNGDGTPDRIIIERPVNVVPPATAVDGADADTKRDDALNLNAEAQEVAENATRTPERFDLAGDLRGDDPKPASVLEGPLAAQRWPGCKTAFVRSFSARTDRVKAIALHYTAGLNRPGWADLDGLTAYSNNVANQVSWHFGIDREGHCTYNVPTNHKAWTIANLNPQTVNIEVVGTGKEPDYAGPGFAKLRAVVRRIGRVHGIPMRLGATDGRCNVTRTGIITHWMGGACSGGHVDIKPYDLGNIVERIARQPITKRHRSTCRKVHAYRHGKRHDRKRQAKRLEFVRDARLKCVKGKPVRK